MDNSYVPKLLRLLLQQTKLPPSRINVILDRLYFSRGISAFTVTLPPSVKAMFPTVPHPHITAYHASSVAPFKSNQLISNPTSYYIDLSERFSESERQILLYLGLVGHEYGSKQQMKRRMIQYGVSMAEKNQIKKFHELQNVVHQ